MSELKNSLASLALDLNRVALGINRGSKIMAERFYQEALDRKSEINIYDVPEYIAKVIKKVGNKSNLDKIFAEKALVYSILIENFVTHKI